MFLKEERETILNYDPITQTWHAWTSYPPHITLFRRRGYVEKQAWQENGRDIAATFELPRGAITIRSLPKLKNPAPDADFQVEQDEDEKCPTQTRSTRKRGPGAG